MTPDQINPGDLLVDPRGPVPVYWFVVSNLGGRDGVRMIRQDGASTAGRDLPAMLESLEMVHRNRATRTDPAR